MAPNSRTETVVKRFHIITFGCQMNRHDSERTAGALRDEGLRKTDSLDDADVVVFNTCCVREHAEERFYGRLSQLAPAKLANPSMLIAVTGCVAQKDAGEVFRRAAHVDLVVGARAAADAGRLIAARLRGGVGRLCMTEDSETACADLPALRESAVHAWLSIATGCDNFCSYCIVPHVRGRERSRPFEDVLGEAAALAADGVLDVTLLGQNVNSYGRDIYGRPRFAELLRALDDVGIPRIRFTTSHPKDLCEETIDVIAGSRHVCPHIHLPVQSGSSAVLARMNRHYTKEEYLALVVRIREAVADVSLSTDVMIGFPGETEADFADTLQVVDESRFDQAFTFIFSRRSGTPAADMEDQIDDETKKERFGRLVDRVTAGARRANAAYVGRRVEVLVEGPSRRDPAKLSGRTTTNKIVHFDGPLELRHHFVGVTITEARTWFLEASLDEGGPVRLDSSS